MGIQFHTPFGTKLNDVSEEMVVKRIMESYHDTPTGADRDAAKWILVKDGTTKTLKWRRSLNQEFITVSFFNNGEYSGRISSWSAGDHEEVTRTFTTATHTSLLALFIGFIAR